RAFPEEQRSNLCASGAEGAQNSDLRTPLRYRDGEGVVDQKHPDEQGEQTGDGDRQVVHAEQRFELASAPRGRLDGQPRPQRAAQRLLTGRDTDSFLEADIDAVKVAAASE